MKLLKKAAISLAVASMIGAPVVATAAPAVASVKAVSTADGQSQLEGKSGWLIGFLAAAAIIAGIVIATDNKKDTPTSP